MTVVKGNFGDGGTPTLDNIDLTHAKTLECEECKCKGFKQTMMLKKLSPLMSPTGQEALVPVQVYSCGNCGTVPKMFLEGSGLGLDEEINKPKEDALSRPDLEWAESKGI